MHMGKMVNVSAKVDRELKRRAEELGINISALVRRALEEEVRRLELESFIREVEEEVGRARRLPSGTVVRIIREMREVARGKS